MSARPVPIDFHHNHLVYHQVKREGLVAMYRVSNSKATILGFEVVILRVRHERAIEGRVVPERETYPGDEDFGTMGWYYPFDHRKAAEIRFNSTVDAAAFVAPGRGPPLLAL